MGFFIKEMYSIKNKFIGILPNIITSLTVGEAAYETTVEHCLCLDFLIQLNFQSSQKYLLCLNLHVLC